MTNNESQSPQPSDILKNNIDLLAIEVLNRNEGLDGSTHFVKKDKAFSTAVHKRENSADIDSPFVETDTDEIIEELGSNLAYMQEHDFGEVKDTLESLENRGLSFKDGQRDALLGRAALGFSPKENNQKTDGIKRSNEWAAPGTSKTDAWAAPTLGSWEAPKTDEVIVSTDVATYIQNNFVTDVATQAKNAGENVTLPVIKKEAFEGLIALIKQETDPNNTELLQRKIAEARALTSNYFEQAINVYTTNKIAAAFDNLGLQVEPATPTELQAPSGAPVSLEAPVANTEANDSGNEVFVTQELHDTFVNGLRSLYEKSDIALMFTREVAEDRDHNVFRIPDADFSVIARQVRGNLIEAVKAESTDAAGNFDRAKYDSIVDAFDREVAMINNSQAVAYEQELIEEFNRQKGDKVEISPALGENFQQNIRSLFTEANPQDVVSDEVGVASDGSEFRKFTASFVSDMFKGREGISAATKAECTDAEGNFDEVTYMFIMDAFDREITAYRKNLMIRYDQATLGIPHALEAPETPKTNETPEERFAVSEELFGFYKENVRSIFDGKNLTDESGRFKEEVVELLRDQKRLLYAKVIDVCVDDNGDFDEAQVKRIIDVLDKDLETALVEVVQAEILEASTDHIEVEDEPTEPEPSDTDLPEIVQMTADAPIEIPHFGEIIDATPHDTEPSTFAAPKPETRATPSKPRKKSRRTPASNDAKPIDQTEVVYPGGVNAEKTRKLEFQRKADIYMAQLNDKLSKAGVEDNIRAALMFLKADLRLDMKSYVDQNGTNEGYSESDSADVFRHSAVAILHHEAATTKTPKDRLLKRRRKAEDDAKLEGFKEELRQIMEPETE